MTREIGHEPPRRVFKSKMRVHDYLFDPAFIVSDGRDYARSAFRAAMQSAQVTMYPIFDSMFSELKTHPKARYVYYPNCRLPEHMDTSYEGYKKRAAMERPAPASLVRGKYFIKYSAVPKKVLPLKTTTPDFRPPPRPPLRAPPKPVSRCVQTTYRESSAQTRPWQPEAVPAPSCKVTPEVMLLDKIEWGPGEPYRLGDLPADFHTTEIINKMRHARTWYNLIEAGKLPCWMKKRDAIIVDVEDRDWIFREAEIDEIQEIRLMLLHKLQNQQRTKHTNRIALKLSRLWEMKKAQMEKRLSVIRYNRDRQLRKLKASRAGQGDVADLTQIGHKLAQRRTTILYDPSLLSQIDHEKIAAPPAWLDQCGRELEKSCSGHPLPRDTHRLCERETKWNEKFLEKLHKDLIDLRLGAASKSAGPLRILKPRHVEAVPRPATPAVDAVPEMAETCYQSALTLQRIIRGRATQNLMYEGRSRSAELIEELKSTQGLDKPEKSRILQEDIRAKDFYDKQSLDEQRESAISALVQDVCGGAVSTALDFLDKELVRLKEERKQHAFYLIALRDRQMREAAEAGRRQKEERRRHEHDEMFKQIVRVTHDTVDEYFREIAKASVERYAETSAIEHIESRAKELDAQSQEEISSIEKHEMVAELVQHFLLPEAHKQASRNRMSALQHKRLEVVREQLFGLLDTIDVETETFCKKCQLPYENCQCEVCPGELEPVEKPQYREDPRWKYTRIRPGPAPNEEKISSYYYFRDMLNCLVDNVTLEAKKHRVDICEARHDVQEKLHERLEVTLDMREFVDKIVDIATGALGLPIKKLDYHYTMKREYRDVLDRVEPKKICECPKELPWKTKEDAKEKTCLCKGICLCEKLAEKRALKEMQTTKNKLTEEQLQELERIRKCKCDTGIVISDEHEEGAFEMELEKVSEPKRRTKTTEEKCRCKGVCKCEAGKRKGGITSIEKQKRDTKEINDKTELRKKEKIPSKCIDEEELAAKPCLCDIICRCDARHEEKQKKGKK